MVINGVVDEGRGVVAGVVSGCSHLQSAKRYVDFFRVRDGGGGGGAGAGGNGGGSGVFFD